MRGATVYRGATRVLERFSLTIARGEQVAILGPNGAGKSTLLKLVSRELYPVAARRATVRILGRENWDVRELRSQIGIVSPELQETYHGTATALDVVLSGVFASIGLRGLLRPRVTAAQRQRARRALEAQAVDGLEATPFGAMSTGQQRRVLLARALVHEPHTLILDEPTAGLDLAASFDYLARVGELVAQGRSIVLVTHMLNEIPPEIERVVLLRAGRILADGPKRRVLTETNLERAYGTPVRLREIEGYWLAWPPRRG